jgi:hypothetical protein
MTTSLRRKNEPIPVYQTCPDAGKVTPVRLFARGRAANFPDLRTRKGNIGLFF